MTRIVAGVTRAPDIVRVSLNKKRHAPKGIVENCALSVNLPSVHYVAETDYCGLVSGRDVDTSKLFTVYFGEDVLLRPPRHYISGDGRGRRQGLVER